MTSPCMFGGDKHDIIVPIDESHAVCLYCDEILEYELVDNLEER